MNCQNQEIIDAHVVAINGQHATISVSATPQKSCAHCQNKGGCQSLSLYQLVFAKHPIDIDNDQYHVGQPLQLRFPKELISQSIMALLGLPLLAFIIGVLGGYFIHELIAFAIGIVLATGVLMLSRRWLLKYFSKNLVIIKIHHTK